ncbi:MAG TPA: hypothetical protein VMF30_10470 [Pirellulales bacterium]|nr:hypothetical protein [Pirellulales bacterium]
MKPVLQALLVADHVYCDAVTGKKIVVGIFHSVRFKPAPRAKEPTEPGQHGDPGHSEKQGPHDAPAGHGAADQPDTGGSQRADGAHGAGEKKAPATRNGSPDSNAPREVTLRVDAGGQKAGSPFCYISLTELFGEQHFELRYVDLAENNSLFSAHFSLVSHDPVGTEEVVIPLPELPVVHAGAFALELLWNDEPLGSHRIVFSELPDDPSDENPPRKA